MVLFALKMAVGGFGQVQQFERRRARRLAFECAVLDEVWVGREPGRLHRGKKPRSAFAADVVRFEAGHHRDAPVPQVHQVLHGVCGAFAVGHRHDVHVWQVHRSVEDDQRHARLEELAEAALIVLRRNRQQPGHALGAKRIQIHALPVGRPVGVGQQQRVAELGHLIVDAPDDGGEEQVLDVGDQDAYGGALPGTQVPGGSVGLVIQLVRRTADALFQVRADPSRPRQDAGDRCSGHTRQRRDLSNCRRGLGVTRPGGDSGRFRLSTTGKS